MAETISLEQIVQGVALASVQYGNITETVDSFVKNPTEAKTIKEYVERYIAPSFGGDEVQTKEFTNRLIAASPAQVRTTMESSKKATAEQINQFYSTNLEQITGALAQKQPAFLESMLLTAEGILLEEKKIKEAIAKGDIASIKKLYLELYGGNPAIKTFIEMVGAEFFAKIYPRTIEAKKSRIISQFIIGTQEKSEIDYSKMAEYVNTKVANLDEDKRKKLYGEFSLGIYDSIKQAEAQSKKADKPRAKKD